MGRNFFFNLAAQYIKNCIVTFEFSSQSPIFFKVCEFMLRINSVQTTTVHVRVAIKHLYNEIKHIFRNIVTLSK